MGKIRLFASYDSSAKISKKIITDVTKVRVIIEFQSCDQGRCENYARTSTAAQQNERIAPSNYYDIITQYKNATFLINIPRQTEQSKEENYSELESCGQIEPKG